MILTELKCINCGAPLRTEERSDQYRCEHCGALYHIEGDRHDYHVITVEHPQVCTLRATARINNEDLIRYGEKVCAYRAMDAMKHNMVEDLADFIKWDKEQDPFLNATMIQGTIRVVEPSFRF